MKPLIHILGIHLPGQKSSGCLGPVKSERRSVYRVSLKDLLVAQPTVRMISEPILTLILGILLMLVQPLLALIEMFANLSTSLVKKAPCDLYPEFTSAKDS
jgi:hypothetical protein